MRHACRLCEKHRGFTLCSENRAINVIVIQFLRAETSPLHETLFIGFNFRNHVKPANNLEESLTRINARIYQ
jgi:hypothetical protein